VASLRQALLGLFGQRARARTGKPGGKRAPVVTQTGTGSFRVTLPGEASGSYAAPSPPRGEPAPKSDREAPATRPMAPARPIETPPATAAVAEPASRRDREG
jgi:hypothetical protein